MTIVTKGATNVSLYVYFVDDDSGTNPGEPTTGLLFSDIETGGSASYVRQGAARTDFTLVTLASASAAHTDGGFILVDDTNMPGLYRVDVPDAAFATGADFVIIQLVAAAANNTVMRPLWVELTGVDFQDTVRGGMTALPNAAADAAGGLPISDAGGLDLDARLDAAITSRLAPTVAGRTLDVTATGEAGVDLDNVNGTLDAAEIGTDAITAAKIAADAIGASELATDAVNEIVDQVWNELQADHVTAGSFGEIATEIADILTDTGTTLDGRIPAALVGGRMDSSVGAVATGAITADGIAADAIGASELATDAVEEIADQVWDEVASGHLTAGTYGLILQGLRANTATAGAATTVTLDAGAPTTVDLFKDNLIAMVSGTSIGQTRLITAYSAGRVATVTPAWVTNPVSGDEFVIIPMSQVNLLAATQTSIDNIETDTNSLNDTKIPQTLNLTASGNIGIDWANVENPTTAVDLAGTDIQLVDTTTTNTDMRGTDNAALASVLGALADAAADGDPTATDTAMQYLKQLINVLVGTTGIVTFPAEQAPANNINLAEVLRAVHADVTGLNGDAMRGTDSAALASVATEARLAELDAANIPADVDTLLTRIPDTISLANIQGEVESALEDGGQVAVITTIATLASQTSFTLTAGSTDNNAYNGCIAVIEDVSTAAQKAYGLISAYSGATRDVTLAADPGIFTMAATDKISILWPSSVGGWLTAVVNALVSGRVDASVGAVATGAITADGIAADAIGASELATDAVNEIRDSILSDATTFAGANIDAAISTRATPAQVNTEVLDVLNVDTFAEPGQETPGATVTLATKIGYLYKFLRNRVTSTSSQISVYNDDATTIDHKSTHSDDATTYDRGEFTSGP